MDWFLSGWKPAVSEYVPLRGGSRGHQISHATNVKSSKNSKLI